MPHICPSASLHPFPRVQHRLVHWAENYQCARIYSINLYRATDSPVYAPGDGDLWTLAKESFQVTDYAYVEMVEHLLKTHLMMEPFCVCILRHLSKLHPLHQLMKYHCR